MGTGEEITPPKSSKAASSTQEMPSMPVTPSYPDWSSSMQAFYGGGGAPPFFPPSATSPTPHPFIWGGQHPMMPPYGTPVPYPTMYHHGVYPHHNMSMAQPQAPLQGNAESDGKASEGKDRSSKKTKATSGSGNDVGTQSGESGSEGSSDHSDDNNNDQELSGAKKGSFNQMLADGASTQNNASNFQTSLVPGNPVPPTNLNIGMDLWPSASAAVKLRPNRPGVVASSGTMNDQWIQDERELKKQKRKQSNRESARKSRLRKQAECEELQHRVETLSEENQSLREELRRLSEECEKLTSENNSIKEELTKLCGSESVSRLERSNPSAAQQLDEGNC